MIQLHMIYMYYIIINDTKIIFQILQVNKLYIYEMYIIHIIDLHYFTVCS